MMRLQSSFAADMTRNLKVKVVAFDLSLILAGNSGYDTKTAVPARPQFDTSKTSIPIDDSSLATMGGIDGDATKHRLSTPVSEAAHTGRLITYSAQQDGDKNKATTDTLPGRKISKEELAAEAEKAALEKKKKYAEKIKMKIATQTQASANVPGGGNILNIATRWLLKEGMGDVLDYTFNRTVKVATLGGYDRANTTLTQLQSQLNNTKLSFVRKHPLGAGADNGTELKNWTDGHWSYASTNNPKLKKEQEEERKKLWQQGMLDMEEKLQVTKANVLFVSGDEVALMLARDRGYYTCRYTGEEKRYGQITTDFTAEDSLQIKDAIDGLIGIALRHSVSFIPFR